MTRIVNLLNWLIDPADAITDRVERQLARMTSGILLVFILGTAFMAVAPIALAPRRFAVGIVCVICVGLYAASRTRNFRYSGYVLTLTLAFPPFFNVLGGVAPDDSFKWLAMSILSAGLFLPMRALIGMVVLEVGAMLIILAPVRLSDLTGMVQTFLFLAIILVFVSISKFLYRRASEEQDKEIAERERAEEELREAHDKLEQRVRERTTELQKTNESLNQEIDQRRRVEEALSESNALVNDAIESISEGFILYDPDFRFVFCNSRYIDFYPAITSVLEPGVRLEDVVRATYDVGGVQSHGMTAEEWIDIVVTQYRSAKGSHEQHLADGRWVLCSERRTSTGSTVAIRTEITERKRAEESLQASEQALHERVAELEEAHRKLELQGDSVIRLADDLRIARDEAQAADSAKSQFLAAMSHELRTPLNAILGFSDVLRQELLGPIGEEKYLEYAKDIHGSGEHLLSLVNDLLDISTIEAGEMSLTREKLSMGELIAESVKFVAENAKNKGIELVNASPEKLPALYADKRAIRQILLNLLSNSLKFTPSGGKITVSVKASKDKATFKIADTGIGIPAERLPNLTSPFVRHQRDPHKSVKGWGLGLAITKSLVDLHDGHMDITSKVDKGTTVSVMLPIHAP